ADGERRGEEERGTAEVGHRGGVGVRGGRVAIAENTSRGAEPPSRGRGRSRGPSLAPTPAPTPPPPQRRAAGSRLDNVGAPRHLTPRRPHPGVCLEALPSSPGHRPAARQPA